MGKRRRNFARIFKLKSRRWGNGKGEFDNTCGDYLSSAFRRIFCVKRQSDDILKCLITVL